ncbi:MAG: class I SAM-dependent methyltransferase [Bacteroidia bacterium]|nr:class I SAM-dependent methyltransferase [Bacteroidia bacterium]
MAFEFHGNPQVQFQQQYENAKQFILPFVFEHLKLEPEIRVMDIGCGEGGVLKAFAEVGCRCLGVDLNPDRIEAAKSLVPAEVQSGAIQFIAKNIYDFDQVEEKQFSLIVFKDSIEHIPDQAKIIAHVKRFLKPGGMVFFGFPPWCMPFGGHQQIVLHKWLSKLPYYHLLPATIYRWILKTAGEAPQTVTELLEIKSLGLSTHGFEDILQKTGYTIVSRRFYLINPIYRYKFKFEPRIQFSLISKIPIFRDFITTTAWYLVKPI